MAYRVELTTAAQRDLRHLPRDVQAHLAPATMALANDPRPAGARKVVGQDRTWRIRVGPYRIVYDVDDGRELIMVLLVTRRSETTYRRLR